MTFPTTHAVFNVTIHGQDNRKLGMTVKNGLTSGLLHDFQMCREFAGSGNGNAGGPVQRTWINSVFQLVQAAAGLTDIKGLVMTK